MSTSSGFALGVIGENGTEEAADTLETCTSTAINVYRCNAATNCISIFTISPGYVRFELGLF